MTDETAAPLDPLAALDPLSNEAPAAPKVDEVPPALREALMIQKTREAEAKKIASDALLAAVEAASHGHAQREPELLGVVAKAVADAEAAGVQVNRAMLVGLGLLAADPVDLDAAPAVVEDKPRELPPEPDPLELVTDADGNVTHVVLHNPSDGVVEPGHNGGRFPVRPRGCDLVPIAAADNAVGPENGGGLYSKIGVRRLYGPETRFEAAAAAAGLSILDWCRKRNAGLIMGAEAAYAQIEAEVAAAAQDAMKDLGQ